MQQHRSAPPPLGRQLREGLSLPRVLLNPLRLPRKGEAFGEGRPAMVIPGLTTGDISTTLLRRTLKTRGFQPEGWKQGINWGANAAKLAALERQLEAAHERSGQKALLMGWSLGGLYARVLAKRRPEHVHMLVTVASPIAGSRRGNSAWLLYEAINDHKVDDTPFDKDLVGKPPVPTLSVWSAKDGIVQPECARGTEFDSDAQLRVDATHFAIGTSHNAIEQILAKIAEMDGRAR